jgi:YqjK-like protein
MMRSRHPHERLLTERSKALLKRSALLRFELFEQGRELGESMTLADQSYAGWQHLKAHPILSLGALLLLSAGRPRRILRWVPRLWWGWDLLKKARRWVKDGS